MIASDASGYGLGGMTAPASLLAHRALSEQRERRGHHTILPGRAALALQALDPEGRIFDEESSTADLGNPERVIVETFDIIELAGGAASPILAAAARAGLRPGPKIDISCHPMWDLTDSRILEWILFLIDAQRVRHVHSVVSCTTFSVRRKPSLRSKQQPGGFSPHDPVTRVGNQLLCAALVILWACSRSKTTSASHQHPLSAYSWNVPQWDSVRKAAGYRLVRFDMRAFGMPRGQPTGLATVNSPALGDLERPAPHQRFADAFVAIMQRQWSNGTSGAVQHGCSARRSLCPGGVGPTP